MAVPASGASGHSRTSAAMGCDIHYVIEKKYRSEWVGVFCSSEYTFTRRDWDKPSPVDRLLDRNYTFFGLLANVRRGGLPGSEDTRPLPNDLSSWSRNEIEVYGEDGHSHSWHSLEEFVKKYLLANADDAKKVELMKKKLQSVNPIHEFFKIDPDQWRNYRVIFWFDN